MHFVGAPFTCSWSCICCVGTSFMAPSGNHHVNRKSLVKYSDYSHWCLSNTASISIFYSIYFPKHDDMVCKPLTLAEEKTLISWKWSLNREVTTTPDVVQACWELPPSPRTHPFPSPHPILEHGDFTLVLCKACFCRVWQTHGFGCEVPTSAPDRWVLVLGIWDCPCVTGFQSHFYIWMEMLFALMSCTFGILYFSWDFFVMNSWYAYFR